VPEILPITADDLNRVHEIDVSEETAAIYRQAGSHLERVTEAHNRPWRSADEWAGEVSLWQSFVRDGGSAFGALDRGKLLGFSVMRLGLESDRAQLAGLYVDRARRRNGVGAALVDAVIGSAVEAGATSLYVSSSRYESAVAFYLRLGFEPLPEPDPGLFALEPMDIHMSLDLSS
jgi:ribosomal protein S18 acetylase RimI-like enzyme